MDSTATSNRPLRRDQRIGTRQQKCSLAGTVTTHTTTESVECLEESIGLDSASQGSNNTSSSSSPEEDATFDLMQVSITVQGLSGIVASGRTNNSHPEKQQAKQRKSKKLVRRFSKQNKKARQLPPPKPEVTLGVDTGNSSLTTTSGEQQQQQQTSHTAPAPMTAVVSCRRNVISSGTAMETFLPSLPLLSSQPTASLTCTATQQYLATWEDEEDDSKPADKAVLSGMDQSEPSTFKMLRCMKREAYHRPTTDGRRPVRHISNYVPETVDLKVYMGCGTEMFPLGVASMVITGEEEGQVCMNLPVKPIVNTTKKAGRRRKSKKGASYFSHDPKTCYSLDEHATLRVALRVLPQQTVQLAQDRDINKDQALEDILGDLVNQNLILELNDENSLIKQLLLESNRNENKEDAREPEEKPLAVEVETPHNAFTGGFFCSALMCSAGPPPLPNNPLRVFGSPTTRPLTSERADTASQQKAAKKKQEAVILPLSMMSSVSDSSSDDGSGSFEDFFPQRAML